MDSFSRLHPFVNFIYFVAVIGFTMFNMHPVCLITSLASATIYSIYLNGRKAVKFSLLFMLPVLILTALINPAFNHEGVTILTYNFSDNPITLESIIYGIFSACMLAAVIQWFSCWNKIMTSDKIIYLFGKIIPKLSLLLTMSLGFVSRFKNKFYEIRDAQRCVGNDMSSGKITERLKKGIKILSLMLTWALDDAVYISESMKSRGYGLRKRTNFAIYRIKRRDFIAMALIIILSVILIYGILSGGLYWQYFPYISGEINGINTCFLYVSYIFLCFMPLITDIKEGVSYGNI